MNKIYYYLILFIISILFTSFLLTNSSFAYNKFNPPYPRIGWQTFYVGHNDFYEKFDLLAVRNTDPSWAKMMKQKHPGIILVSGCDWNAGECIPNIPEEWYLHTSKGERIQIYGSSSSYRMMCFSDLCPVAKSGPYKGMRYIDYLPIWIKEHIDINAFDGINTNGLWGSSEMAYEPGRGLYYSIFSDVDVNANGINDHDEFNERKWLGHWQSGIDIILKKLREEIGENKLIIINSGNSHEWGFDYTNGMIIEKLCGYFDDSFSGYYVNKIKHAVTKHNRPFVSIGDGLSCGGAPRPTKNDFEGMRFGLVTSMFNDYFFSFQSEEANEHYWSYWYDEFDTDLGWPTGPPHKIRNGVWVRFFDKGSAIASTDGTTHEVSDSDLRKFPEYNGPYYRFKGGQQPDFNNGEMFDSITLTGKLIGNGGVKRRLGDGIILLRHFHQTVVSDIVIDNVDSGTSPASEKAELHGFQQSNICGHTNTYSLSCRAWLNSYDYAYTSEHDASTYAIYHPTIGVPGNYAIYEWHGWHGDKGGDDEASNVPYEIHYNGDTQTQTKTVNQKQDYGKWNYLGTYYLAKGTNNYVKIKTQGTDGIVIADAVKFVYQGNSSLPRYNPDINQDNKTNIQDLGILLSSWGKTDRGRYDINQDGKTGNKDIELILTKF